MQIARPFGIPLRLHWSFTGLVGLICVWAALNGGPAGVLVALLGSVALFGSVVLHELGHALAARRYDIDTEHITLYPFGGVAAIERMPEDPHEEMVIAIAGPAMNFVLGAGFGWAFLMFSSPALLALALLNISMGLFNMLPAYPMDGGRVLRAWLSTRMGWLPASKLAMRIGRGFAWAFVVGGVVFTSLSLLLTGAFLHFALNSEKRRLVWLNYQRRTAQTPPWDPGAPPLTTG